MIHRLNKNFTAFIVMSLLVAGCSNETTTESKQRADSIAAEAVALRNTHPAYGEIDPDPTDNVPAGSYLPNAANTETALLVQAALRDSLLKDDLTIIDTSQRKFIIHDIDLNFDGVPETFVAFANVGTCGKEGCTVYLLDNEGMLISVLMISEFPILVMNNITRGWCDLLVNYQGTQYRLKYDGRSYPRIMEKSFASTQEPAPDLARVFDFQHAKYPWFRF